MGLSSNNPSNDITFLQIFANIAQTLERLQPVISDPKAITQFVQDAYALPEAEMAKVKQARESIAQYQSAVTDAEATMKQMDDYQTILSEKEKANKELSAKLADTTRALETREKEAEKKLSDIRERERQVLAKEQALSEGESSLKQMAMDLENRKKDLDAYEASLKAKAEAALKALA